MLKTFSLLLLLSASLSAQGVSFPNPIRSGGTLPATCRPGSLVPALFVLTSGTPVTSAQTYQCTAANTWTAIPTSSGGASPAGSAGCVQLYATSSTFGSGCASGGYIAALTIQSAAETTTMGRLLPGFDGDIPIAGLGDAGFSAQIDTAGGASSIGLYASAVAFNAMSTPTTHGIGQWELDGHLNTDGTNAMDDFIIQDTSSGNATSNKAVFYLGLYGDNWGACSAPCGSIDTGGTFFVGHQVRTLFSSPAYLTDTNCADSAGAAACGSAAAGRFVADAAATSVVVSTTAVTANSEIFIEYDSSLSAALSVTCNATIPSAYAVTARTAGTSFTLTTTANVANPGCFSYHIVN